MIADECLINSLLPMKTYFWSGLVLITFLSWLDFYLNASSLSIFFIFSHHQIYTIFLFSFCYFALYQKLIKYNQHTFRTIICLTYFYITSHHTRQFHPQFLDFFILLFIVSFLIRIKLPHSLYYFKQLWQHFSKIIQVFPQKLSQFLQILSRDHLN